MVDLPWKRRWPTPSKPTLETRALGGRKVRQKLIFSLTKLQIQVRAGRMGYLRGFCKLGYKNGGVKSFKGGRELVSEFSILTPPPRTCR